MNRTARNLEMLFTTLWLQSVYKNVIIKSLCSPISIKFFQCKVAVTERSSRRYMMHSTFLIGQDAICRTYCEVNKHQETQQQWKFYDGADGFTSLIKFCGRVCHFSRHRRLVGQGSNFAFLREIQVATKKSLTSSFLKLCGYGTVHFSSRVFFAQIFDGSFHSM